MTTTTAAILHINTALEAVGNTQMSIEPAADPELGYRAWGGKDAQGVVSRFLSARRPGVLTTIKLTGPTTSGRGLGILHHDSNGNITGGPLLPGELTDIGVEPYLGKPPVDGYVLSSTVSGGRSWVPMSGGGGAALPPGQIGYGNPAGDGIVSSLYVRVANGQDIIVGACDDVTGETTVHGCFKAYSTSFTAASGCFRQYVADVVSNTHRGFGFYSSTTGQFLGGVTFSMVGKEVAIESGDYFNGGAVIQVTSGYGITIYPGENKDITLNGVVYCPHDATFDGTVQVGGLLRVGKNNEGNSTPRQCVIFGNSGFGAPGAWNTDSPGDKFVWWNNGIDTDVRIGQGGGAAYWIKAMGTGDADAFRVYTSLATTGNAVEVFTISKLGWTVVKNLLIGYASGVGNVRQCITIGPAGWDGPGTWQTNSNGDKIVLARFGDTETIFGVGGGQDCWLKAQGTGNNLAFSIYGGVTNSGAVSRVFSVSKTTGVDIPQGYYKIGGVPHTHPISAGMETDPVYTDNGDGSLTFAAGQFAWIYENPEGAGQPIRVALASWNPTLVDGATNYIVTDYNGGSIQSYGTTDVSIINETSVIPLLTVYRQGTNLHVLKWSSMARALPNKLHQSIVKTQRYRRETGLTLSSTYSAGIRAQLTGGKIWIGANPVTLQAVDMMTDSVNWCYMSGGRWAKQSQTSLPVVTYNNGTDQVVLTANRYAVCWMYRGVEAVRKCLYVLSGTGDYTLPEARASQPPANLPPEIASHAVLVGRFIVQKSAAYPTQTDSAFDIVFSGVAGTSAFGSTGVVQLSDGVGGFTGTENLNFTAATGLQIEANIQEALAVRYGTSAAGQRVGVCFQLWDSIGNEMCYARAYGEIIDSTDGIEKGGFVIQTLRSGTLTDAFYIGANGNVGIGDFAWDDKPARQLHVRGAVAAERVETMIQNTDETGFTSIRHFVGTTERGSFRCHGTTYIGSGTIFDSADMVQLKSVTAAGLSIAAENGPVRLFTGGLADANIRIHISSAGFTAFGAGVPRYMLDLYGTGSRLHLSTTDADSGVYIGSDAPNSLGIGAGAAFDGTVWKGKVAGNCSIMWMHAGIFGVYGQACTVGNNVTSVVTFEVGVGGVAGFGVASTSTARILLPAVTAGIEPVNMGAGAAALSPSTIRAGAIWLNVTNGLQFAKVAGTALVVATRSEDNAFSTVQTFAAPRGISFNGSTGVLSTAADFGFDPGVKQYIGYIQASKVYIPAIAVSAYSQVSAITVNTEQSILSASLMGGTTLPAPVLGQRYKVRASGLYSASVANTLTVRFKMSNSTVVTYTTPSAITAASVFVLELEVIWSSATVCIVFGLLTITPTAGGSTITYPIVATTSSVVAASVACALTIQHSMATTSSLTCYDSSIQKLV